VAYRKSEAPPELLETVARVEARADECWRGLELRHLASDVARWAVLARGVQEVERQQALHGVNTPYFDAALIRLGRLGATALKWATLHAQTFSMPLRWTGELSRATDEAFAAAKEYSTFEVCFQGFHKEHYSLEPVAADRVRFSVPGTERDRQVSAYQKGYRPTAGTNAAQRSAPAQQNARAKDAFEAALRRCRPVGALGFACDDLSDVWRALLPEYRERIGGIARRPDTISLGPYRLDEFNAFYAAFIAVAAANDFLCYQWGRISGTYPIESAVVVRSLPEWRALLSHLSGVPEDKCAAMLSDLTFSERSIDLRVHPLVPLDHIRLALAPPMPLSSRHDENILRVCSQRRPDVYSITSLEKQAEMLSDLCRVADGRFGAQGPVKLPTPIPDIDFLAADEESSTLLIAELKWVRKPLRPAEIGRSSAEVLKGIAQLAEIRKFLEDFPEHLRTLGNLPRRVDAYERVYYIVAARDHWCWTEASCAAMVTFEALAEALRSQGSLRGTLEALLRYEWLPMEGRDFYVQYDRASVNGVAIESPVFYSTVGRPALPRRSTETGMNG
jgi:hypothetical protein